MLTIKGEVKKDKKKDGTYSVRVRFTMDRMVKRISTNLFVTDSDLNKKGELKKNSKTFVELESLISDYRHKCNEMQIDTNNYSLETIVNKLLHSDAQKEDLDFIVFSRQWVKETTIKGAKNYNSAINSFVRFLEKDTLNVKSLTVQLLKDYTRYLKEQRKPRKNELERQGRRVPTDRAVSLYLGSLRHLYKEMQMRYNDPYKEDIAIPYSPFEMAIVPKQGVARKRALTADTIRNIYNVPYKNVGKGYRNTCRHDLARDCFLLSFGLMGMNSVDLYNAKELRYDVITYNRTKTKDRRQDKAKMMVVVPEFLRPLLKKYKDPTGERVFCFHNIYSDETTFNRALNVGLKEIGDEIGVKDLTFYAARHSWATIALNKAGVDKYSVHSALNHVDETMRVTDTYIERDFGLENEANEKVMDYVFSKILHKDLEHINHSVSCCFFFYSTPIFA